MAVPTITPVKKPKINLPYADPNNLNAPLPLQQPVQPQVQPQTQPTQPAAQPSLTEIQREQATVGQQKLGPLAIQKTEELLRDPLPGIGQDYVSQHLDALRRENQMAYETARQGMAPTAGSSISQRELVGLALSNVEQEREQKAQLEKDLALLRNQALVNAIASGQDVMSSNISNLMATKAGNIDDIQATYEMLLAEDPTAAFQYLQSQLGSLGAAGVQIQPKSAEEKAREATRTEYETAQYEWALRNQDNPAYVNPQTMELTSAGLQEFNRQQMSAISGEITPTYQSIISGQMEGDYSGLRGGASPDSPNYQTYQSVLQQAPEFAGFQNNAPPAYRSVVKSGGKIYYVADTGVLERGGKQYVRGIDLDTGTTVTLYGDGNIVAGEPSAQGSGGYGSMTGGILDFFT